MRLSLCGNWQLTYTDIDTKNKKTINGIVPGSVELDLQKAGLISDVTPCDDISAAEFLEGIDDWTYTTTFDAPKAENGWTRELVFEGLDTIADVTLNGVKIIEARNMFIPHRANVDGLLKETNNVLEVVLRSPLLWARENDYDPMTMGRGTTVLSGQTFLRKARHHWGWDNAPRLLTVGIWRPVYIEYLPPHRFDNVYLYTERVTDEFVWAGFTWNVQSSLPDTRGCFLEWKLSFNGKELASGDMKVHFVRGKVNFQLPRSVAPLWWPRGFGEANLCDIELKFKKDDTTLCFWQSKWGLSRIRLDRDEGITQDGKGEFKFVVNNEPCYIMGTNWKPTDAIPAKADDKVIPFLETTRDLGCNMIRIWGGGFYENDKFFNWCDENGVMVWQDFMFAGEYPTLDKTYCDAVAKEARVVIESLRNHVSLAVWCGDNEDDEFLHWNHSETSILPSDNKISREVLREAVLRFDPYRKYVESSPYISDTNWKERHAPDVEDWKTRIPKNVSEHMCEIHLYTPVPTLPKVLRECKSRFLGETGPYYTCAISDNKDIFAREYPRLARLWDEYFPASKRNLQHHQTDSYLQSWLQVSRELCSTWFGRDFTLDDWDDFKFGVNVICSAIFKEIIEFCRVDRPNKTGVLWWSLADMWQMLFNYSVIDSEGGKKMPYYWIKESQQAFALMIVRYELDGEIALYSANNTLEKHRGSYRILAMDENNNEKVIALGEYDEAKNCSRMLQRIPEPETPTLLIIEWKENGKTSYNHFVTGKSPVNLETWKLWCKKINQLLKI
ncbi:MAG: hypothetical protein J6B16_03770 [Clostridia bacterium]|nr:hypothetical protein [Clostridia bacterium]